MNEIESKITSFFNCQNLWFKMVDNGNDEKVGDDDVDDGEDDDDDEDW